MIFDGSAWACNSVSRTTVLQRAAERSMMAVVATTVFGGFRTESLEFLRELRSNNSREWFTALAALEPYRRAVLDDDRGAALEDISRAIGESSFGGRIYKHVPAGLPADHPRADWLRHG